MRRYGHILLAFFALTAAAAGADLPRVLIIGDGVYTEPAREAAKELKGRAEVVQVKLEQGEVCSTRTALTRLDMWLCEGKWDVIHFNFGLGDLACRAPGMRSFRLMPVHAGGVRSTDPKTYERNLNQLVTRLKATGAKLVWASTTPIRHSSTGVFEKESEIEYNAVAARVMRTHGVPVNDMYTFVLGQIDMTKPASHGADPFHFDRKPIHAPIVESIVRVLGLSAVPAKPNAK